MLSHSDARPRVGIGFRAEVFEALAERLDLVDVVEVTAEHYIYGNRRVRALIEGLKGRVPIVAHGVTLSLGTAVAPDRAFLREIVAFLRVDPTSATAAFPVIRGDDYRTIVFADGRGFLDYEVFEDLQVVIIDKLTWLE